MITREEAKAAADTITKESQCGDWFSGSHPAIRIVLDYVNQEPEDPNTEVWKEIREVVKLIEADTDADHYITTDDGKQFAVISIQPSFLSHGVTCLHKPSDLLDRLRTVVTITHPKPTLEIERLAHKVTQEKLATVEKRVADMLELLRDWVNSVSDDDGWKGCGVNRESIKLLDSLDEGK